MARVSTELILVRHGQSVANVSPVIGGMTGDVGLTELGHRQAELLAERLRTEGLRADVLYASTLPRAQQTAGYLSQALDLPVRDEPELQEVRVGDADGLSREAWRSRWPGFDDSGWQRAFHDFASGGESWAQFLTRAGTGLVELVARHPDQRIVAVTHGGVIEASVALAFGLGPTATRVRYALANTGLTTWRHDPDPGAATWTLVRLNDAAHLTALPSDAADPDDDRPAQS